MINKHFEKLAAHRKSCLYVHIYVHTDKNRKNQKKKINKKKSEAYLGPYQTSEVLFQQRHRPEGSSTGVFL